MGAVRGRRPWAIIPAIPTNLASSGRCGGMTVTCILTMDIARRPLGYVTLKPVGCSACCCTADPRCNSFGGFGS